MTGKSKTPKLSSPTDTTKTRWHEDPRTRLIFDLISATTSVVAIIFASIAFGQTRDSVRLTSDTLEETRAAVRADARRWELEGPNQLSIVGDLAGTNTTVEDSTYVDGSTLVRGEYLVTNNGRMPAKVVSIAARNRPGVLCLSSTLPANDDKAIDAAKDNASDPVVTIEPGETISVVYLERYDDPRPDAAPPTILDATFESGAEAALTITPASRDAWFKVRAVSDMDDLVDDCYARLDGPER